MAADLLGVAILTIVGGNLLAVTQRDVKRMLAYSSVANAGYMLVAITVGHTAGVRSAAVYLATYAVMNLGAFGVVLAGRARDKTGTTLDDFAGLGRRRPATRGGDGGLPLRPGWYPAHCWIRRQVLGLLRRRAGQSPRSGAHRRGRQRAGMFYYLRVIWAMYFTEPEGAVAPTAPVAEPTPAPDEQAVNEPASADGGAVAVAERIAVATSSTTQEQATTEEPATILSSIGLAIAVVGVFALGIAPWLVTPVAAEAARMLFAGR